ncbi:hypothetical protein HELRODRAFT_188905 [Helobdella robusta]|uniref:Uncharacterized protein n=1 Tax=Helobdella robusta TaxID=6412 RepID=T1FQG7_HELRO|nr:hypothetical protein HELRODRAFT_188905 [Helobdella robusta]ESN98773.1 hypothetical protein HELRODRAFT_188905 [Helobdella robusta]
MKVHSLQNCFINVQDCKKFFLAGIQVHIRGLLILIGIILYIGAITEEAGSKSKPNMEKPKFEYWYGYSFVLTITSFSTAELTGVLSVYLYISRHKHSYRKKAERLHQNQNYTTSFNQLHSRSAISLSNVVEVSQKQQQQQQQQSSSNDPYNNNATTTNTSRSPNTIRSNGRANGYIGGLGAFGLRADDCAGYVQQQQQQMFANNNNNNNNLPAYDASPMYVVDSRDMEAQSSYQQKGLKQHPLTSWSSSCFQQPQQTQQKLLMSKPASSASMLMMMSGHVQQPHEQWLSSDMPLHATLHNSNLTADYNYHNDERLQRNDVDDDDDDDDLESTSNYEQSTPRMLVSVMTGAPIAAGLKSRESSKHALASGLPQSTTNMNTPLSSERFTPNHARNLGTPDTMYRRTTPSQERDYFYFPAARHTLSFLFEPMLLLLLLCMHWSTCELVCNYACLCAYHSEWPHTLHPIAVMELGGCQDATNVLGVIQTHALMYASTPAFL